MKPGQPILLIVAPETVLDIHRDNIAAGFSLCGGYANAFSPVPDDWLLDGDKATDGTLRLRDALISIGAGVAAAVFDNGSDVVYSCAPVSIAGP